jgi:hypothetical protein
MILLQLYIIVSMLSAQKAMPTNLAAEGKPKRIYVEGRRYCKVLDMTKTDSVTHTDTLYILPPRATIQ